METTRQLELADKDRQILLEKSDSLAALALSRTLLLIVLATAIAGWIEGAPVLRYIASVVLFGCAQIGLAVLMHECAHRTLFRSTRANDWVGRWLCAEPILQDLDMYRRYHLDHHKFAGTSADPDAHITADYPVSGKRFTRKLIRDITGATGVKVYLAVLLMKSGFLRYQLNGRLERQENPEMHSPLSYIVSGIVACRGALLVNGIFLFALTMLGRPEVFLLWLLAMLTTFQVILRLRQIGDHGMVPDRSSTNPFDNTRTTDALLLERIFFAPHNVHLHLEHHLMPGVPCYRLPYLRSLLVRQGLLTKNSPIRARSYAGLLKSAVKLPIR